MDWTLLFTPLFVAAYGAILGLVAPYVGVESKTYGSLVPTAIAVASGSILLAIFTWLGFHYDEAWIWLIVMLGMPAVMWFGANRLAAKREAE
jgi:hypothetical protein